MNLKKHSSTELNILNAAKEIFERKGMAAARMQEIADEAGINKAMLHYYYRSKQLLFEAVFKKAFSTLAPQLNDIINADNSLFDKIKNFTHNYITFIIKHPYLPNFIIQELNRNPEFIEKQLSNKLPNIEKFRNQIENAVKDGHIRPIKAEHLFINIIALNIFPFIASPLLKGFLKVDKTTFKELMEERKTEVVDFILNSIKIK
ncbi:TetR/AcrR family transcriptional regulator [uncultured Lutibacter sp.]|uniref:TetR/AcrR family transcriptional regulator n=1 Tax=uncultured Lutibacter sp. TaxID=437739 RepID=UPI00260CF20D|nr:TetR/AcrR family transcriptional regulator [uncultured Lutibacter sp.]